MKKDGRSTCRHRKSSKNRCHEDSTADCDFKKTLQLKPDVQHRSKMIEMIMKQIEVKTGCLNSTSGQQFFQGIGFSYA